MKRTFEHFTNAWPPFPEGKKCPLCGTSEDRAFIFVQSEGIAGDIAIGDIAITETIPVHADCAMDMGNLRYNKELNILYKLCRNEG